MTFDRTRDYTVLYKSTQCFWICNSIKLDSTWKLLACLFYYPKTNTILHSITQFPPMQFLDYVCVSAEFFFVSYESLQQCHLCNLGKLLINWRLRVEVRFDLAELPWSDCIMATNCWQTKPDKNTSMCYMLNEWRHEFQPKMWQLSHYNSVKLINWRLQVEMRFCFVFLAELPWSEPAMATNC